MKTTPHPSPQIKHKCACILVILSVCLFTPLALAASRASTAAPTSTSASTAAPTSTSASTAAPTSTAESGFPRPYNLFALSVAYQAPLSLDKSFAGGVGIFYTREYFVSRRTALGVHAAVRVFPAAPFHLALGYGLTIKHYITTGSSSETTGFYLLYGLLLQMNVLAGRSGTATGHDTRLSVGYDWYKQPLFPFVEAGYHLTQVRGFDEDALWWPYAELVCGLRF